MTENEKDGTGGDGALGDGAGTGAERSGKARGGEGEPLPPDVLAGRLSEVFAVLGPLYRRTTRALELKESKEGFPVGVRAVLELLRMGGRPMTVPQMGRTLALSRQFVQRMVNEAAGRDLVEAIPNPAHQRSSLIRLTDTGRTAIDTLIARESVLLERAGGDLTGADIDACVRVLTRMLALFEDVDVN